jgi:hypothetical protein
MDVTGFVGVVASVLPINFILRAVAILVRVHHAIVLKGDGHYNSKEQSYLKFFITPLLFILFYTF